MSKYLQIPNPCYWLAYPFKVYLNSRFVKVFAELRSMEKSQTTCMFDLLERNHDLDISLTYLESLLNGEQVNIEHVALFIEEARAKLRLYSR